MKLASTKRHYGATAVCMAALVAGCMAATPQVVARDDVVVRTGSRVLPRDPRADLVDAATQAAAAQVRRCYRWPRVVAAARQMTTRLLVRYTADGMLAGTPMLIEQRGISPATRAYAGAMAGAAIEAVTRCAPLNLPAELHAGGWDEFQLTFSAGVRA